MMDTIRSYHSQAFRDGIVDAIYALGNNNSTQDIAQHMKQQAPFSESSWWWEDREFKSELQNAVNRGDIIQANDSYTSSAVAAIKCKAKQQEKEMYEAMQQSKKDRRECADMLLTNLKQQDQQTKKQQNNNKRQKVGEDSNVPSLSKLGLKLESLLLNDRMIIVPMIEIRDNATNKLKGIDKKFQDAIDIATDGSWTVLNVVLSRVDTIEGNPGIKTYADYEGDVVIDALYDCDGTAMYTKLLDKLNIVWSDEDLIDGTVSCYCWEGNYYEMWQNGETERVGCYDCDGNDCPLDDDSDYEGYIFDEGHTPRYENTLCESLLIGISKELIPEQKQL